MSPESAPNLEKVHFRTVYPGFGIIYKIWKQCLHTRHSNAILREGFMKNLTVLTSEALSFMPLGSYAVISGFTSGCDYDKSEHLYYGFGKKCAASP